MILRHYHLDSQEFSNPPEEDGFLAEAFMNLWGWCQGLVLTLEKVRGYLGQRRGVLVPRRDLWKPQVCLWYYVSHSPAALSGCGPAVFITQQNTLSLVTLCVCVCASV